MGPSEAKAWSRPHRGVLAGPADPAVLKLVRGLRPRLSTLNLPVKSQGAELRLGRAIMEESQEVAMTSEETPRRRAMEHQPPPSQRTQRSQQNQQSQQSQTGRDQAGTDDIEGGPPCVRGQDSSVGSPAAPATRLQFT